MSDPVPSLPFYPAQAPVALRRPVEPPKAQESAISKPSEAPTKPVRKMHPKMMENIERMKRGEIRNKKRNNMGSGVSGDKPKKSSNSQYY